MSDQLRNRFIYHPSQNRQRPGWVVFWLTVKNSLMPLSVVSLNAVKPTGHVPALAAPTGVRLVHVQTARRVKTHKPIAASLLLRLPVLAGLTESEAIALSEGAQKKTFKNNEILLEAGQSSNQVFIILSGRANVILNIRDDKELAIASLGIGECVGEMAALDQQPHCTNVVADGPLHALMLNPQTFVSVLCRNPQVASTLLKALFRHMVRADRQIMWLTTVSVQGRVARTLMDLAVPNEQGQLHIKAKVTSVALAKKVGASREMVGKTLKNFESKGFIRKTLSGGLHINDKRKKPRH
jgi:CRP/FNR family cyclic AMP-dependent transcriptional regulator